MFNQKQKPLSVPASISPCGESDLVSPSRGGDDLFSELSKEEEMELNGGSLRATGGRAGIDSKGTRIAIARIRRLALLARLAARRRR